MWGHRRFWWLLALAVLVFDQISKYYVLILMDLPGRGSVELLPFLSFTMVWNRGISMGIPIELFTGEMGLILLTGGIALWLGHWLRQAERVKEGLGLALILGGAVGNLLDRLLHGAVVDFVHLHSFGYDFYVFNLADAAITIGVLFLVLDGFRPQALRASGQDAKTDTERDAGHES